MNVAIIGHGFVGKALKNGLLNVETYIVDPKLKTKIEELSVFKPEIIFGDGSSIGGECHISSVNKIIIGKNVLLGRKITLVDNSHGKLTLEDLKLKPTARDLTSNGPIIIKNNVWIGDKATVLPGVIIGENSIIGANAVVTKNVPPNSVVVGVPGKVIKKIVK